MLLPHVLLLLLSSTIVSSQKSSDILSPVVPVTGVIATPSVPVEKSTSLVPTNRVTTAPTPSILPTVSAIDSVPVSKNTVTSNGASDSVLTKSTPTVSASISANSTLSGSFPEMSGKIIGDPNAFDVGEIEYGPDNASVENMHDLTAYEIDTYAGDVASGEHNTSSNALDQAKVTLPVCPDVGANSSGPKKRATSTSAFDCSPKSLTIPVYINWVTRKKKTQGEMDAMEARVAGQFAFLDASFGRYYKIKLVRKGSIQNLIDPTALHIYGLPANSEYAKMLLAFLQQSRAGADDTLNIWITEEVYLAGKADGQSTLKIINGYSNFPGSKKFDIDGIVIKEARIGSGQLKEETDQCSRAKVPRVDGGVLLHELGHWMGLRHTFEGGCTGNNDNLASTPAFSNSATSLWCCTQTPCLKNSSPMRNWNWMSYSACRGTDGDGVLQPNSFTTGQKAAMYAQFLTFRRKGKCNAKWVEKRGELATREEHAIIHKRAQDKATVLADLLLKDCSVAIQAVFQEDSIPLAKSVLQSYSSVASSMQANPTSYAPGEERPATATRQTAVPTTTDGGGGGSSEKKPNGSVGNADLGKASMLGAMAWFFGLFLML